MNKKVLYFHNKQKDYDIDETSDNYNELVSNAIEEEISEAIAEMSEYLDENISVVGHYYNVPLKLVGKIELPLDYNSNTPMEYFEYMYRTNDSSAMVNLGRIINKSIEISDEVANEVMSVIDSYSKSEIDSKLKAIEEKLGEGNTNIPDSIVDDFREALNAKLDISQWQEEKEKFATKEQVQKIVSEINIPELDTSNIDLSNYATNESVDTKMANKVSVVEFNATKALLEDNKLDKEVYERDKPTFALKTELALKRNIDDTYSKEEIDSRFNNANDNSEEINRIVQEKIDEFVKSRKAKVVVFEDTADQFGVYFKLVFPNEREELYYLSIPPSNEQKFLHPSLTFQSLEQGLNITVKQVHLPIHTLSPLIYMYKKTKVNDVTYIYFHFKNKYFYEAVYGTSSSSPSSYTEIKELTLLDSSIDKIKVIDVQGNLIVQKGDNYYISSRDNNKVMTLDGASIPLQGFNRISFKNIPSKVIDIYSTYLNNECIILCENGDTYFCGAKDSSKFFGYKGASTFTFIKTPLPPIKKLIKCYRGTDKNYIVCCFLTNDNVLYRPLFSTSGETADIQDSKGLFKYKQQAINVKDVLYIDYQIQNEKYVVDIIVEKVTGEVYLNDTLFGRRKTSNSLHINAPTIQYDETTSPKVYKLFSTLYYTFFEKDDKVVCIGSPDFPSFSNGYFFSRSQYLLRPLTSPSLFNNNRKIIETNLKTLDNVYSLYNSLLQVEEPSEEEIRQGKNAKFTLYWRDMTYTLYV